MASVFFRYRSSKKEGFLTACLLTGFNGNSDLQARSKIKVDRDFWNDYRKGTRFQDDEKKELKKELDEKTESLQDFIINRFDDVKEPEKVDKEWLKRIVSHYNNPRQAETIPSDLVSYIDYYVQIREKEGEFITDTSKARYKVIQNKLIAFQEAGQDSILIKDINNSLKVEFIAFSKKNKYAFSTYQRDMIYISTFAKHARTKGIETHPELDNFKIKIDKKVKRETQKLKAILSFAELDEIGKAKDLTPKKRDARDWLLISCYCGQRIGDFMRFNKSMLYKGNDSNGEEKTFIKFTQEKTGELMDFPLHPKVVEILNERNGEFPEPIADQKYNVYIKQVCRSAKINQLVKGGKISKTEIGTYRKETGKFEKWRLIQSHTGRRSFATNFFRLMDMNDLMYITGHTSTASFLLYVNEKDKKRGKNVSYGNV